MLSLAVLMQGCAAKLARIEWDVNPKPEVPYFAGTLMNVSSIAHGASAPFHKNAEWSDFLVIPFFLIDLPLSFVADILFIPHDWRTNRKWRVLEDKDSMPCENIGGGTTDPQD